VLFCETLFTYILLDCENTVPDKLGVVNSEDGSVTWLTTGMLTVEDSISADQLGLDCINVQVHRYLMSLASFHYH